MFKQFRILFILLLIFIVPFQVFSQPSISINTTSSLQNAQVMYFSNFDIFDFGNPQYLFDVTISNITQQWDNTKIILEVEYEGQIVASAESDDFDLTKPQNKDYWTASNIDLISNKTFPGSTMEILFNTTKLILTNKSFENELLGSGKAKSGKYILRGRLENALWSITPTPTEIILSITNPSNIQLSDPGNKAGSGSPQEILNEFPVFSFFSDGKEYVLSIYERQSHHSSIEDVINSGNPTFISDPIDFTVLNYADASSYGIAQPLQTGSTYYWFVDVLVSTTAGTETFRSEVYQFKVVGMGGNSGEGQAVTSVIEMLRPVVGNEADNLSKNLTNFELKTIKINGKTISIYELQQIIESYEGHLLEISELALY